LPPGGKAAILGDPPIQEPPVSYLQCPECRLTVPAAAYYLRGDECPRCLTAMEPLARFARQSGRPAPAPRTTMAQGPEAPSSTA
jgi:hypothetical protein